LAKKGRDEISMKMRLIALVIAAAVMALGSLVGCVGTPSTTEVSPSSSAIRVTETIGITDSPQTSAGTVIRVAETIGVTDSPQTSPSAVIMVAESIGVTDSPQMSSPAVIRIVETIGVTDSQTLTPSQPQPPPPPPQKVTVTVTSPKAGEVWRVGTAQNIGWTTTGEGIAYVGMYYSIDGGKSMISIAKNEPNDGIYTWKVPNTPSKTVLVRVLAFNVKGETLALGDSGLFTISIQ